MNDDMKPLLQGDATDFERRLLASAVDDGPNAALETRMRLAVGLGAVGAGASVSGLRARWESLGSATQWALGIGGAVVLGGAALVLRGSGDSTLPRPVRPEVALERGVIERGAIERGVIERNVIEHGVEAVPTSEVVPTGAPQPEPVRDSPASSLQEEVKLLDAVRAALGQGQASEASQLLADYAVRFPRGVLSPEAAELRVRVRAAQAQKAD